MGMYDTIKQKLFCAFCGQISNNNEYQTKNFSNWLDSLDICKIRGFRYNIYNKCDNCYNWIELVIEKGEGIHTLEEGKKMIEKRKKEMDKLFNNG